MTPGAGGVLEDGLELGRAAHHVEDPDDHVPNRVTFVITNGKIAKVLEGKDALDPTPALGACTLPSKSTL